MDEPPGDILVFLTGQDEIESMARLVRNAAANLPGHPEQRMELEVLTLYAAMPPDQQMKVCPSGDSPMFYCDWKKLLGYWSFIK